MPTGQAIPIARGAAAGSRHETALALAVAAKHGGICHRCDRHSALPDHAELARVTAAARLALQEVAEAAAMAAARAHSMAEALTEAFTILEVAAGADVEAPTFPTPPRQDRLSPREQEVLALVAEGRSNKAIAEELFVSPNTIKTHVASLLSKLHVNTRAQLAAIATRQGPRLTTAHRSPPGHNGNARECGPPPSAFTRTMKQ